MKRILSLLLFTFSLGISNAQIQYVPDSVYFVMEVDLGKVVKSISLEEIDKLEVTKSILSKLNNTPENDIQLSDLGVDFNSKLIAYLAEKDNHSNTTVIIPIKDMNKFIQTFDDFDQLTLKKEKLLIKEDLIISMVGNTCVITQLDWKKYYFSSLTEDLYTEKGWELPEDYYFIYGYDFIDFEDDEYYDEEIYYEEEIYEIEDATDAEETESIEEDYFEEEDYNYEEDAYIVDEEDLKYQEELKERLREVLDSIKTSEEELVINEHLTFLKNPKNNLLANDPIFKDVSSQVSDAKIFLNPFLNPETKNGFEFMPFRRILIPEFDELRQFAFLNFNTDGIQIDWKLKSSEKLGKVYNKAASGKLNKDLLKYIPDNAQGFGVYNVNTFGAYEQLKETYLPILDASDDGRDVLAGAVWSTIDEFINMEAISSVYPPEIIFSYAGLKEVELPKVTYDYDEETFQYTEVDTTYIEHIPMVNFVIANERAYLLKKYFNAIMKFEEDLIVDHGNYYTIHEDPMNIGFPYYIAIIEDIILITNDEETVIDHLDGYSKKAFHKSIYKKAKKSKMFYAHLDLTQLNKDLINVFGRGDELLTRFEDKTAKIDFEMTSASKDQMNFSMKMKTNEKYKNGAHFLFDLLNEIHNMGK